MTIRELIDEWAIANIDPEDEDGLLLLDPPKLMDSAIVGVSWGKAIEPAVIYDEDKVLRALKRSSGREATWEDVREFFDFNTASAYHGPRTWRFVKTVRGLRDDYGG